MSKTDDKKQVNPIAAAAAGLAVGAAAGAAAAVFTDEKKRRELKKTIDKTLKTGQEKWAEVKGQMEDLVAEGKEMLGEKLSTLGTGEEKEEKPSKGVKKNG